MSEKRDPDVFVVLKDGNSYGEKDGTPLCVELREDMARHRKIGRCIRYVPEAALLAERTLTSALEDAVRALDGRGIEVALLAISRARTERESRR